MSWFQKTITLEGRSRGFHLVTREILEQLPELKNFECGRAHFFLKHTSASLSINENADASVRHDLDKHMDVIAPENAPYYVHTYEGPDDMPAHIKSALVGCEVTIPVSDGQLALGTWQGLYLGEHRDHGGPRSIVVTLSGEPIDG
jgi:secondary thiamine-phosphate synthase enzyme